MTRHRTPLTVIVATLVAITACASVIRDPPENTTSSSTTAPGAASTSTTEVGIAPTDDAAILSPTIELMSFGLSSSGFHNELERAVSSCMQLRGWTYEPQLHPASSEPRTVGEKKELVRIYGYRIFSWPEPSISTGAQREVVDRNHQRMMTLSPTDRDKYWRDLDGGPETGEGVPPPGSCRGDAQIGTGSIVYNLEAMGEMAAMSQDHFATAEFARFRQEWAACMSDNGFEVDTPADAYFLAEGEGRDLPIAEAIALEVAIASADFECELQTTRTHSYNMGLEIVRALIERYPEYGRDR